VREPHLSYRADVDGLRAVAVLSVIGFHAFPRTIPGGFVGVDVFFVISGFLISGLILQGLRADRFSYVSFYARRIRRIFPALITVLTATLIGGSFMLFPDELKELGRQALASVGFVANFFFWSESGYFDASAPLKPLLHLWSLGIEEQFYIGWPLLLVFLYQRTRHLKWIFGALALASFLWNVLTVATSSESAFYLPMSRFWELLLGAMLALQAIEASQAGAADGSGLESGPRDLKADLLCVGGLLLIGGTVLRLTEHLRFPGWWALLPTVGAALVIAGGRGRVSRLLLGNKPMTFIGLISYPLYLWHWVLLSAVQYVSYQHASHTARLAAIALSFLLAWLTYVFIETPIRFGRRGESMVPRLATAALLVGAAAVTLNVSDGVAMRFPPAVRKLATFHYDAHHAYREDKCQLNGDQAFAELDPTCVDSADHASRLIVLWGDSHVSSLYQGMRAAQRARGDFRIAQFAASGCPPLLGVRLGPRSDCMEFSEAAFERIQLLQPDTVIMGGAWYSYASRARDGSAELQALRQTIDKLIGAGIRRVVVFGDLPVWKIHQPNVAVKIWQQSHTLPARTYDSFDRGSAAFDSEVAAAVLPTPAVFVSPVSCLCSDEGCLLSADPAQPVPVTWDYAHLTDAGSRLLVEMNTEKIFGAGNSSWRTGDNDPAATAGIR
jgi:peptidoglycan/LPS O-acetylase OafA/YrhL